VRKSQRLHAGASLFFADYFVLIEMPVSTLIDGERMGFSDVMKERSPTQDPIGGRSFKHPKRVFKDVMDVEAVLLKADGR